MEINRKPFQGVLNIIRFNWHFYIGAIALFVVLIIVKNYFPQPIQLIILLVIALSLLTIVISFSVSYYIYDWSDFYELTWLDFSDKKEILNINAGFDESSEIIQHKFPESNLIICDFFNPEKHTEISIQRARKLYPPNPETISVTSEKLPFNDNTFDISLAILSAHEIRNDNERVSFFKELSRVTKSSGQIMVTEHLRDWPNFLAYTIGFFHFHSRKTWLQTFKNAGLTVSKEIKKTPFISTFILTENGYSA